MLEGARWRVSSWTRGSARSTAAADGCRSAISGAGRLEIADPRLHCRFPESAIATKLNVRHTAGASLCPHPLRADAKPFGDLLSGQ
jgi:hypothetical protein